MTELSMTAHREKLDKPRKYVLESSIYKCLLVYLSPVQHLTRNMLQLDAAAMQNFVLLILHCVANATLPPVRNVGNIAELGEEYLRKMLSY